jgi:hypothetical protein
VLLLDTALANLASNSRQSVSVNAANSAAPLRQFFECFLLNAMKNEENKGNNSIF